MKRIAEEIFKLLTEAYGVLSDEEKRRKYDHQWKQRYQNPSSSSSSSSTSSTYRSYSSPNDGWSRRGQSSSNRSGNYWRESNQQQSWK